jgi:hypothetical protein
MINYWIIGYISGLLGIFEDLEKAPDQPFMRVRWIRRPTKLVRLLLSSGALAKKRV